MHVTKTSACFKQEEILTHTLVSFEFQFTSLFSKTKAGEDKWILQISTANLRWH
jgi:hypothetical protein